MKNKLLRRLSAVLLLALAAGCNPPKYAVYESINKDYTASVPWGWQVMTDQQDNDFAQTTFIGPFDPDFYLGAPSLSVRWYRRYRPHRLSGGRLEMYSGADDFIKQTLSQVYGPEYVLMTLPGQLSYKPGPRNEPVEVLPEVTLKQSGLKGNGFIVESATPAPEANKWGISEQAGTGKPYVLRKHAYVVVPVEDGFYVLTYPATERGYPNHLDKFAGLMGSFMPRTAGPGGAKIRVPGPRAS
ncbi:MAG: hypothetical protein Q8T11_09615 [Elusimicrobiota bacterium]|nr:hypothetical protein [Elusimicrobiota bacterium]